MRQPTAMSFFSEPYYAERRASIDGRRVDPQREPDLYRRRRPGRPARGRTALRASSFYVGSLISGATAAGYAFVCVKRPRRRERGRDDSVPRHADDGTPAFRERPAVARRTRSSSAWRCRTGGRTCCRRRRLPIIRRFPLSEHRPLAATNGRTRSTADRCATTCATSKRDTSAPKLRTRALRKMVAAITREHQSHLAAHCPH